MAPGPSLEKGNIAAFNAERNRLRAPLSSRGFALAASPVRNDYSAAELVVAGAAQCRSAIA
jgi:hypothetical protein